MSTAAKTTIIEKDGKRFVIVAVDIEGGGQMNDVAALARPIIERLWPYITLDRQVVFVRDQRALAIDGKYPAGNSFFPNETQIAVPAWPADETHLKAALAHELHHLARWQHPGYGQTLGEAVVTEGLATLFEQHYSGWTPPWAQAQVSPAAWKELRVNWDDNNYSHQNWFFNGPHGRWIGYSAGYQLAKRKYGDKFDLEHSVTGTTVEFL